MRISHRLIFLVSTIVASGLPLTPLAAADLKPEAVSGFANYTRDAESRIREECKQGHILLWLDSLPAPQRREARMRLERGDVLVVRPEKTTSTPTPGALIHDWVGTIFIPGASLHQVLALVQDYDRHQEYYAPDVAASKLLSRSGDNFRIYLRFRQTRVLTVVLDTEHDVFYTHLDAMQALSRSYSTRIAEIKRPGEKDEHALPPGKDNGFLWALNSYWRFLQRDGGVYVQCEAISLTRDIPTGLGFLLRPFVEKVPRDSLTFTLQNTRLAVLPVLTGTSSPSPMERAHYVH